MGPKKELNFEEALTALEAIVGAMESGELSLENGLKKFEEGMKLAQICSAQLNKSEKKVEILMRNAEACLQWQQLPEEKGDDLPGDEDFHLQS